MDRWLTSTQRRRADQLVSAFENATTTIDYVYAENLHDGRGVTVGRAGFTTGTGDALDVIEFLGAACPPDMSRFLPELRRLAILESDDTSGLPEIEFIDAWRSASATSLFRAAQDQIVDREYYEPAMRCADRLGIETPLARAQLYDAAIQHGVGGDPDSLGAMIKRTIALSDGAARVEASWLNDFFDVRITTLRSPTNSVTASVWRDSVDRVECMRRLAVLGNFNLVGPFEAEVFGLRFMIT